MLKIVTDLTKDARKWLRDTNKVYKSGLSISREEYIEENDDAATLTIQKGYHFKRDLMQPINGLMNIGLGLLAGAVVGVAVIVAMVLITLKAVLSLLADGKSKFFDEMKKDLGQLFEIMKDLPNLPEILIRGLAQVLTTPFTYLVRIPLRAYQTWKNQEKPSKIEDSENFQAHLAALRKNQEDAPEHYSYLVRKLQRGFEKGVTSAVTPAQWADENNELKKVAGQFEKGLDAISAIKKDIDHVTTLGQIHTLSATAKKIAVDGDEACKTRCRSLVRLFDTVDVAKAKPVPVAVARVAIK